MPKATINADVVRNLAALLDETGLTEIEYETGTLRVRVSRQGGVTVAAAAPAPSPVATAEAAPARETAPAPSGDAESGMNSAVALPPRSRSLRMAASSRS